MSEVVLKQKTPIRVLHRRNNDTRPRTIHKAEGKRWEGRSENWFYIDLLTQAGTYIKEFVHGDFGRTKPNVSEILGCECDIVGLDVTNVHLDWPPTAPEQIVEKSS
ncbi:Oidioi.mRNA.OKI2018_I69.chr2.g7783.t1.cds [Oikopleura dioica]|uniref:tRNA pseudouridine(55) synthase n=1 Tax=Oikopleura dioica TaxID=34765 RepID=A0ABN7T7B2_OIKDI|nr:Oidioi.mRNA.OKI2018_I69.chr2.g7783.t1.cds [Oikopleura dioica]